MDRYLDGSNVQDLNVSVSPSVGGSEDADARDRYRYPLSQTTCISGMMPLSSSPSITMAPEALSV